MDVAEQELRHWWRENAASEEKREDEGRGRNVE